MITLGGALIMSNMSKFRTLFGGLSLLFSLLLLEANVSVLGQAFGSYVNSPGSGLEIPIYTHCLDKGGPIQLADPFDPRGMEDESFVLMQWVKVKDGEEKVMVSFIPGGNSKIASEFEDKVSIFQTWGLEIRRVSQEDSASYRASIKRDTVPEEKTIKVVVASAPRLESEQLTITSQEDSDGQRIFKCGTVASLGEPPVRLLWKDQTGQILNSTFKDGFSYLEFDDMPDSSELVCEVDDSSPGEKCIPSSVRDLWDTRFDMERSTQGADSSPLLIGIAVALGLIILIIIVVVVLLIYRRRKETYNPKKGEKRKMDEVRTQEEQDQHSPLQEGWEEEDGDVDGLSSKQRLAAATHKSPSPSPYHVSDVNPANQAASHYASSPVHESAASASPSQQQRRQQQGQQRKQRQQYPPKQPPVAPKPHQRQQQQQKQAPLSPAEETAVVGNGRQKAGGAGGPDTSAQARPTPRPRMQLANSREDLAQVGGETSV